MKRRPDFVLPELGISPHIGSNTTYFVDGDDDYLWYNNAAMAGGRRIKLKHNVGDYKMSPIDTIFYTNSPLSTFESPALGKRVINNAAISGGRKPVFRQKRKIRSHPLSFHNPFYTTGAKIRIPERSFARPIRGLSTIGDYANTLRGEPLNSVYNQPLLDRTPQYEGAHSQWTSLLPKGVNSVEARDRRLTAQREIEAQHAGVYSKKEQRLRALQRMMYDWTKAKDMKKIMQMLTEHDELGGIPKQSKEKAKKVMEEFQKKLVTSSKRYLDLMHENDRHPTITTQAMPGAQLAQTPAEAKEQHEEEKSSLADLVRGQTRDDESAKKAEEKANEGSEHRAPLSEFGNLSAVKPNIGVNNPNQLLGINAEPYGTASTSDVASPPEKETAKVLPPEPLAAMLAYMLQQKADGRGTSIEKGITTRAINAINAGRQPSRKARELYSKWKSEDASGVKASDDLIASQINDYDDDYDDDGDD